MDNIVNELREVSVLQQKIKSNIDAVTREIQEKVSKAIAKDQDQLKELQKRDTEIRARLLEAMEENGVKSFSNDFLKVSYVAPQIRTSLDTARLKEEAPEVFEEFSKETEVKAHLKISVYETDKEI